MRKVILLFISSLVISLSAFAQQPSHYYWSKNGSPIWLQENRTTLSITFSQPDETSANMTAEAAEHLRQQPSRIGQSQRIVLDYERTQAGSPEEALLSAGIDVNKVAYASWGLLTDSGTEMWLTNRVIFAENGRFSSTQLDSLLSAYPVAKVDKLSTGHTYIELEDMDKVLPLSNALYQSGMVHWAQPDFAVVPKGMSADPFYPGDSLFGNQYYLHNTGQMVNYFQGTDDIDIDAPEAWSITRGDSNIVVAVIDQGLQYHHEFLDTMGKSRILEGYTTGSTLVQGGVPQNIGDAHGMAVAGIIAASHDSMGVSGIAPFVKLMPIHIFIDGTTPVSELAAALDWAWRNGADVINNSWVIEGCDPAGTHPVLEAAIDSARLRGRDGKGCVISFSTGQRFSGGVGSSCVYYPANLPQVLAVGACDPRGSRPNYTNYGPTVDIVAPSAHQSVMNVTVVDLPADSGFNTSSNYIANLNFSDLGYTKWFGGTSASCAQASGVAALLLSHNPALTESQVRNLMTTTAVDLGDAGFDNEFGHGLLNAYGALVAAGGTMLPVTWQSFEGMQLGANIRLDWTSAVSSERDYFVVEKWIEGSYLSIGQVAGAIAAHDLQAHTFTDTKPFSGINTYRIRYVDENGEVSFSSVVEVLYVTQKSLTLAPVFPNPVRQMLHTEVRAEHGETVSYHIQDLSGRRLITGRQHIQHGGASLHISVEHLSPGLYILSVRSESATSVSQKFVVQ